MCSQTYSNFDGDAEKYGTNKSTWDKIIEKQMRVAVIYLEKAAKVMDNF